jgi:hypothetical protein
MTTFEDWRWAHVGWALDAAPLTPLLFEIRPAVTDTPDLVAEVSVEPNAALIRGGAAEIDPSTFVVSACSNQEGTLP